jgi:hypothetical protein
LDIQTLVRGPTLTLAAEYETEMEALVFSAWVFIDAMVDGLVVDCLKWTWAAGQEG